MDENSIAMPSSGDPEKDKEELARFIKSSERIEDGVCPNGCALMVRENDHTQSCPVCNFSHTVVKLNL